MTTSVLDALKNLTADGTYRSILARAGTGAERSRARRSRVQPG